MIDGGRLVSAGTPAEVLTPERVESVYGIAVHVLPAPDGHLIVIPHRGLSDTVSS